MGTVFKIWSESLLRTTFLRMLTILQVVLLISEPQSAKQLMVMVWCIPKTFFKQSYHFFDTFCFKVILNKEDFFSLQLTVTWCFVLQCFAMFSIFKTISKFKIFRIKVFKYPRESNNVFRCILKCPLAPKMLLLLYFFLNIVKRNIVGKRNEKASKQNISHFKRSSNFEVGLRFF